uniref:G-protein coupled receptors family 1 profile domain-containing protein n=1 Tax=Plectus sambesii TaxID=2011161 RepID=A0A914W9N7_9BILA
MLMAVIVKFLISHLMPTALDVGEHIVGSMMFQSSRYASFFIDISNMLIVFNSSTNFWIYLAFGRSFRASIKALLTCAPDTREYSSAAYSSQKTVSRYDSREGALSRMGKNGQRSSCVAAMSNPTSGSQTNCLTVGSVVQWNDGRLRTLPRASIEVLI